MDIYVYMYIDMHISLYICEKVTMKYPVWLSSLNKQKCAGHQWLTPAILVTQEEEIRKIMVQRQLGQIVCKTLSQKHLSQKRAGGLPQGRVPEFKPQFCPPHQK
jgi:hypothetical protein